MTTGAVTPAAPRPDLRPGRAPGPGGAVPMPCVVALSLEVAFAALAVLAAVLCWQRGFVTITVPLPDRDQPLTRMVGPWLGAATGLAVLGSVLLLDAVRRLILIGRARRAALFRGPHEADTAG